MSGQDQLQTVKDYIAKYNLEDELSNAVNQAIKLDSDDPFRVISDYLKQFAKVRATTTIRAAARTHARQAPVAGVMAGDCPLAFAFRQRSCNRLG